MALASFPDEISFLLSQRKRGRNRARPTVLFCMALSDFAHIYAVAFRVIRGPCKKPESKIQGGGLSRSRRDSPAVCRRGNRLAGQRIGPRKLRCRLHRKDSANQRGVSGEVQTVHPVELSTIWLDFPIGGSFQEIHRTGSWRLDRVPPARPVRGNLT